MVEGKSRPVEIGTAELTAIRLVETHSPTFAKEHPEIVEDTKTLTHAQVAEKYKVAERFGVTEAIAKSIVAGALKRLLTAEQRAEIITPRIIEQRREVGKGLKEQGKGIFGRTSEERERDAGNAGKIGGQVSKDKGVGIFGRSAEQRVADAGKAGSVGGRVTQEKGVGIFGLSREELSARQKAAERSNGWFSGKIIEGKNEGEYALYLASQPEYQKSIGRRFINSPDCTKIMEKLNELYEKNRSREAVVSFFRNERKGKRKSAEI